MTVEYGVQDDRWRSAIGCWQLEVDRHHFFIASKASHFVGARGFKTAMTVPAPGC
ncbi:MAG TPA: hypothetical protein VJ036_04780 [bacterium]|nr:hypothetical protein [bacterium]